MAMIKSRPKPPVTAINKFLGVNEDTTGETQLVLGESPYMRNFRITENYKLRKREGYKELFTSLGASSINGMWYGTLNGSQAFLFSHGGYLYSHNLQNGSNVQIGAVANAPITFLYINNKVYMWDGTEYRVYNGTTLSVVAGYVPTVAVATPPTGGGTVYEQANLLTGKKKQSFSGNGSATVFTLAEKNINSVDEVVVNGAVVTPSSVNLVAGTVTLSAAPSNTPDNVEITWTKTNATDRAKITKCRFAMLFGGGNDTRVFLWGNGDFKNTRFYTDLDLYGKINPEYFPINNNTDIGSSEFAITDIIRQYDRQIIYTEKGAYYSSYTLVDGKASFPVYSLNSVKGNIAEGQVRLIQNNPYTIFDGLYEWVSTTVRDERNATYISKRIQPTLDSLNLKNAIAFDFEEKGEYWLVVGSLAVIYNYRNGTWYIFDNIPAKCFITIDGALYFGTNNGQIMKFDKETKSDNGNAITAVWEMGFYDFEAEYLRKYLNSLWFGIQPETRSRASITYQTDKNSFSEPLTAFYSFATFVHANFGKWSFKTNYNPQPFKFKIKAKKFSYFKLTVTNNSIDEDLTLLSINFAARFGGEVK